MLVVGFSVECEQWKAEVVEVDCHEPTKYYGESANVRGGLLVRFHPRAHSSWTGLFARGPLGGETTLLPASGEMDVLVVNNGQAIVVDSRNGNESFKIPLAGIQGVLKSNGEIVVCWNQTDVVAVDKSGPRWSIVSLSWDGFEEMQLQGGRLVGLAWDAPSQQWCEFDVDAMSGVVAGGVEHAHPDYMYVDYREAK